MPEACQFCVLPAAWDFYPSPPAPIAELDVVSTCADHLHFGLSWLGPEPDCWVVNARV